MKSLKGMIETLSAIDRELAYNGKKEMKKFNITKIEGVYLRVVGENPGITQYNLSKLLKCSKSLVITHITKLEKKGFIEKRIIDTIRKELVLTTLGKKTLDNFDSILNEIGEAAFNGFSNEEIHTYIKLSNKIKKNLEEYNKDDRKTFEY